MANLTGKGVGIAFLDTGIIKHPDFDRRVVAFLDVVHHKKNMYDDCGHGTHVAGIACGTGKLSGGRFRGIAPEAKITAIKILDEKGAGSKENLRKGIDWVLQNYQNMGIRILNISSGTPDRNSPRDHYLVELVERAWDEGLIVTVAAGNLGPGEGSVTVPGNSRKVITVGAYDDCKNGKNCFSGRGPTRDCICKPEVTAKGNKIISCSSRYYESREAYCVKSGTSMAVPAVSGAIALLLEKEPHLTNVQVKMRLRESVRDLHLQRERQGWGILDLNTLLT